MKRLISIELQKISQSKSSRNLLIIYFILINFVALIASIKFEIGFFKLHLAEMGIFNFPYVYHFNTYIVSLFKWFFALIVVSMITNEYTYGTLKQNLIDGMTKKQIITSKFLTILLFSLLSTVFVFVLSLILGYFFSSYTELSIVFRDLEFLLAYFFKIVGFFSFVFFLGTLFKKSVIALAGIIVVFIVENISYAVIKFGILKEQNKGETLIDKIYDFMPLESLSNLLTQPFTRLKVIQSAGEAVGQNVTTDYQIYFSQIAIVSVWIFIFIYGSYLILKKRDL